VPAVELRDQPHLAVDAAAGRLTGEQRDGLPALVILAIGGLDGSGHGRQGDGKRRFHADGSTRSPKYWT